MVSRAHIDLGPHTILAQVDETVSKDRGWESRFSKIVIFRASGKKFGKIWHYIFFQNDLR